MTATTELTSENATSSELVEGYDSCSSVDELCDSVSVDELCDSISDEACSQLEVTSSS
jgi:hypothetical protein